ncbi:hypothetical protein [Streptomyces longwoodensis]|uniref:hypothetical protein n=1 Tax=Streptomyces longwoodensis TaxID=68231 RepID=UPI003F53E689
MGEHLELWLGAREDGGDGEIADLAGILSGNRLPRLRSLALRNSEMQDEVAAAMGAAPIVANLDVLDLSLGTLTDTGAEALLGGQPLTHLRKLDLHHNYLSEPMKHRVRDALEPADVKSTLTRPTPRRTRTKTACRCPASVWARSLTDRPAGRVTGPDPSGAAMAFRPVRARPRIAGRLGRPAADVQGKLSAQPLDAVQGGGGENVADLTAAAVFRRAS